MAPKPVLKTVGSGISLDNEMDGPELAGGESGSSLDGGSGGSTTQRLFNTSIDTEKLEAVVFVVVGQLDEITLVYSL